jgi:uncharacterized membrane protein
MPAQAAFCPGCGRRMIIAPARAASRGILSENVAAALAYFSFIPAIIFLNLKPFQRNRLVRFHSFQSIFLAIAAILAGLILRLLFAGVSMIPGFGYLLASLAVLIVSLAFFFIWLVAVVKAFQGELFRLPLIGGLAERA